MQIPCCPIFEVEPVNEAGLDERLLQETVGKVALRSKAGVEPRFVSLFLSFAIEVISLLVEVELRHPDVENILKIMSMASFYDFDVRTLLFHKSGDSYITFYIVACRLVGNVLCIQYFRICFFQMGGKRGSKLAIEVDSLFRFHRILHQFLLAVLIPRDIGCELAAPVSRTSGDMSAFEHFQYTGPVEDVYHFVESRVVESIGSVFFFKLDMFQR